MSRSAGNTQPWPDAVVGVLGGMGPQATVDFLEKVIAQTPADSDQEHVPILVSVIPQIPDRTAAFRGEGASPLQAMLACADRLKRSGAELLVIPCNTAHLWYDEIQSTIGLPMIHIVDAALDEVCAQVGERGRVGLLATDATVASGLYVNRAAQRASAAPIRWLLPTAQEMLDWVTPGIAAIKSGNLAEGEHRLRLAAQAMKERGASALVLGCTEIPLVLRADNIGMPVVDATWALARHTVAWHVATAEAASAG